MAEFPNITEVTGGALKAIPKFNVKKAGGIIAAVIGAGVVFVLLKNKGTTAPAPAGTTAAETTDNTAAVADFFNQKLEAQNENFSNYADSVNAGLRSMQEDYSGAISDLKSQLKTENNTNYIDFTTALENLKDDINDIERKASSSTSSTSSKKSTSNSSSKKTSSAGLGNNGVESYAGQYQDNETRLKNDSSFKASEVNRTVEVINNRTNAGLDTKVQKEYLASLLK